VEVVIVEDGVDVKTGVFVVLDEASKDVVVVWKAAEEVVEGTVLDVVEP